MINTVAVGCVSGSQVCVWTRPQNTWNSDGVHPSIRGTSGLRIYVSKDSTSITVFLLFFMEVTHMLVAGAYKYYN